MAKQDLILHPVRLRILMTIEGRRMTVQEIARQLPDVAQATLYRHVNTLAEAGILQVVAENPVRGTVEKTYALADLHAATLTPEDMRTASKDDHIRYFGAFVGMLTAQFARYLDAVETADPVADGVGYHTHPLYLSDAEMHDLTQRLGALLTEFMQYAPGSERKRRLFSTIFIPDPDGVNE